MADKLGEGLSALAFAAAEDLRRRELQIVI